MKTRHPSIPLAGFLDAGGRPGDRLPGERLRAMTLEVANAWTPGRTIDDRRDRARAALAKYQLAAVDQASVNAIPVMDSDGRRVDEIVGLWSADLLRDGELFVRFVAALPTRLRAETGAAILGKTWRPAPELDGRSRPA